MVIQELVANGWRYPPLTAANKELCGACLKPGLIRLEKPVAAPHFGLEFIEAHYCHECRQLHPGNRRFLQHYATCTGLALPPDDYGLLQQIGG